MHLYNKFKPPFEIVAQKFLSKIKEIAPETCKNMKRNQKIAIFLACGGPKRIKEWENIDFKIVLKKSTFFEK